MSLKNKAPTYTERVTSLRDMGRATNFKAFKMQFC